MASTDQSPGPTPAKGSPSDPTPGAPMSTGQKAIDTGAEMMQTLKPINQFSLHACSFGIFSHDMSRQIETHHFCSRLSQDFVQCAVYSSNDRKARLVGVEYIVPANTFETFPPEEQRLWHSHAYEIKSGIWVNPRVPEMIAKPELENFAKTYGKFWCTWQIDRGDKLPMGAPALMMSPQAVSPGIVRPELVHERDAKYGISSESLQSSRMEIEEPEMISPIADYWKQHGKGFAIDFEEAEMKRDAPFP
ncbi:oil body-associated protein 2B-like [Prosopis cineraria]|uniref:oil body-associated protein 2B-like n=1 Tax=Prosopis cineraria TaxID=364024 RepID=UPI0024106C21|nr:oil body-associated protein 2B-like [Prosopis cineraria]